MQAVEGGDQVVVGPGEPGSRGYLELHPAGHARIRGPFACELDRMLVAVRAGERRFRRAWPSSTVDAPTPQPRLAPFAPACSLPTTIHDRGYFPAWISGLLPNDSRYCRRLAM